MGYSHLKKAETTQPKPNKPTLATNKCKLKRPTVLIKFIVLTSVNSVKKKDKTSVKITSLSEEKLPIKYIKILYKLLFSRFSHYV